MTNENDQLKQLVETPWPKDMWLMTTEEYILAVPNDHTRTVISGFLYRCGWNLCFKKIEEIMKKSSIVFQECPECSELLIGSKEHAGLCIACLKNKTDA